MPENKQDMAVRYAARAANLSFDNLTDLEVEKAKKSILDLIGVMIAGSTLGSKARILASNYIGSGGNEECTVFGYGKKVPLAHAAVANGALAHTLDYDDAVDDGGVHPAAAALPSAFAICEKYNKSGKDLLEAFIVGADTVARLGNVNPKIINDAGWLGAHFKASWGASIAAGKAYGLDSEGMLNCMGLMLQQAAGSAQALNEGGNDCRELYDAFAAHAGIFSASLAHMGIRGPKQVFEGKNGLFNNYFEGYPYHPEWLDVDESSPWLHTLVGYKPWSSCRGTHVFVDGIRTLAAENGFDVSEIARISCGVGAQGRMLCEPYEDRYTPVVGADARYSIPFTVAATLVYGTLTLANFTDEGLRDPKIQKVLAEKFEWHPDDELIAEERGVDSAKIDITLKDGRTFFKKVSDPLGSVTNPMDDDAFFAKFRDCCTHGAVHMSEPTVEKLIDLCMHLEDVEDVGEIAQLCS